MALTIKVSGQAEFSQIKRELRGLNTDFSSLQKLTRGGIVEGSFTKSQVGTFKLLQDEIKKVTKSLDAMLDSEYMKVEQLTKKMQGSTLSVQTALEKEIQQRMNVIDNIQKEIGAIEEKTEALKKQGQQLDVVKNKEKSTMGGGGAGGAAMGGLLSLGKKALALAGIAGIGSMISQGVAGAAERQRMTSQIGMRIGGANPDFEGLRRRIRDTGLASGYTFPESYAGLEAFTSRGGGMTRDDQLAMQQFARAKGLDLSQVGGTLGEMTRFGASGKGSQREFANMLADAIDKGRMQERAVEAMEATAGIIGEIGGTLPTVNAKGILGLQTALNQTGVSGFMGERGADIIGKLNSMFTGGDKNTEFVMLRALGWGKNKDYYQSKLQAEKGISDPRNLSAVLNSLKSSGMSPELIDMALSKMGGLSLTQAATLRTSTNNYQNLSPDKINAALGAGNPIQAQADIWAKSTGGWVTKVDAQLEEALSTFGNGMLVDFYRMKQVTADMLNMFSGATGADGGSGSGGLGIGGTTLAVAGIAAAGMAIPKLAGKAGGGIGTLLKKIGKGAGNTVDDVADDVAKTSPGFLRTLGSKLGGATKGWGNAFTKAFPKAGGALRTGFGALDDVLAKVAPYAAPIGRGLGAVSKGLPFIGGGITAINARGEGDSWGRSLVRGAGSILGGIGGGALGTLALPGIGTFGGAIGGSYGGDKAGGALYDKVVSWFTKSEDKTEKAKKATVEAQSDMQNEVRKMNSNTNREIAAMAKAAGVSFDEMKKIIENAYGGNGTAGAGLTGYGTGSISGVPFASLINQASAATGVDPSLIAAVMQAESNFNPNAMSHAGAMGLMQLMPGTASGLGVKNSFDPLQNTMGGAKYLKQMLGSWNGDPSMALASYNWGIGNVHSAVNKLRKKNGDPNGQYTWNDIAPFAPAETQNYVSKIMQNWQGGSALSAGGYSGMGARSEIVVTVRGEGVNALKLSEIKEVAKQVFSEMSQNKLFTSPSITVR